MVIHMPLPSALGWGMEQFHHPRPVCVAPGMPTPQRRWLMDGLRGRVLEIGAGDGVKLTCYPAEVEQIVLVEPDPFLRSTARGVGDGLEVPVCVVEGEGGALPVRDASCDAVICSLVLCCASPAAETLAEIRRVLRPGGQLRFLEHQRSGRSALALAESLVGPLWARACGGCRPDRDTLGAIRGAGFTFERLEPFTYRAFSHALGIAVASGSGRDRVAAGLALRTVGLAAELGEGDEGAAAEAGAVPPAVHPLQGRLDLGAQR